MFKFWDNLFKIPGLNSLFNKKKNDIITKEVIKMG